ncbi:NADH-quinone oxidoreductase subunit N [Usitatibacter palustris]|uniref:NADH-quinone oxidoreductase subunit N n=1 Tax=Usitatibacter palustris TaxID=2732487 RepID=A0A6M4H889_9PROT|nr:NADH-quinone oxidoreductase subunit N [Usitatibacter palustris]QJR14207.1 NADH-quinone oxidoreductase subunit N [Usitatibacter palustris]
MNVSLVFTSLLPEHLLLAGILTLIAMDVIAGKPRAAMAFAIAVVGTACAAALALAADGYSATPFPGQLSVDPAALLAKALMLGLAVPALLLSREAFASRQFHILALSSLYGACLMVSADSFLTLFLGVELLSLPVYVLVLLAYQRPESAEAALKYLVLGGAASATLLMGASLLLGWSGSLELATFARALGSGEPLALAGSALVLLAFFLKAAVVPFHAWAPDAYEGASAPVTAFMAVLVKAGVLLAAVRLFGAAPLTGPLLGLVAVLPLASIVWGNLAAMRQQSFRRMIAYSSIAHAGYLFYAFLGDGALRFQAVAFYVLAYGVMNLLAFAALPPHADDVQRDRLDHLAGLFRRRPYAAILIAIAMFSLAGLPPFPGFVAKFLIFKNAIAAGHTLFAVLGLVGSYIGIYFYLRVVQYLFMNEEPHPTSHAGPGLAAFGAGALCLAAGIVISVLPGWVLGFL